MITLSLNLFWTAKKLLYDKTHILVVILVANIFFCLIGMIIVSLFQGTLRKSGLVADKFYGKNIDLILIIECDYYCKIVLIQCCTIANIDC